MEYNNICLNGCSPAQVINFTFAVNDISVIDIYNNCDCKYDNDQLKYSYSLDNVCWTCYMTFNEAFKSTTMLKQDFYLRIKINNIVGYIKYNNIIVSDYNISLFQGFDFKLDNCSSTTSNTFNPYANLDCAIMLQTQLAETVACMFGIPIYYFKLTPNSGSQDITFKEYALMDVESVKQIKLIIKDGQMPSSKPEFADFGLEWQSDWETEISKGMFSTAFGINAQPMEGDLIYIPMMKRMWMVNGAYEEKNDSLMWNSTTFKITLVKYQEKASVDLGDTEDLVNSFVKNKYEDLFSDEENIDAQSDALDAPKYAANNLYPVFESDATRKYVSCDSINITTNYLYYKATLIADSRYEFLSNIIKNTIIYQKKYCGSEGSCSFILSPLIGNEESSLIQIGDIHINIVQDYKKTKLFINKMPELNIELESSYIYFIVFRWSKALNYCEFSAYKYVHNEKIPQYKLSNAHYWFDIDNPVKQNISKFNIELIQDKPKDVLVNSFIGWITNIKLFDVYNDNTSELLQMYPTHQHLIINDTVRKIVDLHGVTLK